MEKTMEITSSFVAELCDRIEKLNIETLPKIISDIIEVEKKHSEVTGVDEDIDTTETLLNALATEPKKVLKFVEGLGLDLFDYERGYAVICSNGTENGLFPTLEEAIRYAKDSRKNGDKTITVSKNGSQLVVFERYNYVDFGFAYVEHKFVGYWKELKRLGEI